MKTIIRGALAGCLASLLSLNSSAVEYDTSTLWSDSTQSILPAQMMNTEIPNLSSYRVLQSATQDLTEILASAPDRSLAKEGLLVDLPLPNNRFVRFRIFRDSIMEPELAEKFPHVATYWGYDESNPKNRGRFDVTDHGFHGMFSYNGERIFVDPLQSGDVNTYINYRKSDAKPRGPFFDRVVIEPGYRQQLSIEQESLLPPTQPDGLLRSYRLAVATTGEYTQFHGGTVSGGLSAVVTTINRVNEVYESDFSVRLNLVGDNDQLIYTNPNSDPYTNGNGDLNSNTGNINSEIGSGSYDVGHIFQTSGGGVAGLGVVCSSSKGRGLTGLPQPTGDPFYIDYVAHEIGHQFDGLHTFNGTSSSCGGANRSSSAAYEPGSGATVMAYAGICDDENLQNNSDPYFHTHSISEVNAFITNGGGSSCASISDTGNTPPLVEAGINYTIPANTPFTLVGSASDADTGDEALLTYVWEQYDLGSSSSSPATMVDNGNRPIFRSFIPTNDPSRTFPNLDDILEGTSTLGVSLPTTNRNLDFRLTVRDTKGGVAIDDMVVTVSNTGQSFEINSPSSGSVVTGGQLSVLTWNVAGTSASPINCSQVDVDFSSDNGATFATIVSGLANNGSGNVVLPNSATNNARIKLKCSDNIFFAMSDRFNVQVGGPNQAPSFNNDPIVKADAASGSSYSASLIGDATDPDGNPLIFSLNAGPAWLDLAPGGALSGTPENSDIGLNSFSVSVSDGEFSDSATLNITVTEAVATVGITTVESTSTTTQNRRAMPYIMPEDGVLKSISMYHTAGDGDMILAVYADDNGLPGDRLALSAETPVSGITGWQTINLLSDVFIPEGTQFWLAWIYEDNPGIFYSTGSPGRANINETWSNGADNMPASYGASTQANFRYSIYATYTAGGDPIPSPTPSPSPSPAPSPTPVPTCSVEEGFESGAGGWINETASTCSTGSFISGAPTEQVNGGVTTQVGGANTGDAAFYTASNSSAGVNDVDGGNCITSSPTYSVSSASTLSVAYFHGQRDAGDDSAGDFFQLELSTDGGNTFSTLVSNGDSTSNAAWQTIEASIPSGANVVMRVQCSDGAGPGDLVECGIDDVTICPNL